MLRVPENGRGAAQAALRSDQLGRAQGLAAGLTLVAPGTGGLAVGAGALNIAVRQKALAPGAKGLGHGVLIEIVLFQQGAEDVLGYLGVVGSAGGGK